MNKQQLIRFVGILTLGLMGQMAISWLVGQTISTVFWFVMLVVLWAADRYDFIHTRVRMLKPAFALRAMTQGKRGTTLYGMIIDVISVALLGLFMVAIGWSPLAIIPVAAYNLLINFTVQRLLREEDERRLKSNGITMTSVNF